MVRLQTRFTCCRPSVINDGGLVKGLRGLQHLPFSNNLLNSNFPSFLVSTSALCIKHGRGPRSRPKAKAKIKLRNATFTTEQHTSCHCSQKRHLCQNTSFEASTSQTVICAQNMTRPHFCGRLYMTRPHFVDVLTGNA